MEFIATVLFFIIAMVAIAAIQSLPIIILLTAIISLIRKKNMTKRTIVAIAVIPVIFLLNTMNRNGRGPTEVEYFLWQLQEGSIWAILSLIGYLYLIYWIIFLTTSKNRKPLLEGDSNKEKGALKVERKKLKKGPLISFGALLVILSITFIWHIYPQYIEEKQVLTSKSSVGDSTIEIVQVGQPAFFGPASIKIYYQKKGNPRYFVTTSIANDGRPAYHRNFIIYWEDNENVIVTINGDESAETIKINVLKKY